MNPIVKGSLKSKTIWAAAIVMFLSMVAPLAPAICHKLHLDPDTTAIVGGLLSALIAVLRFVTNQSLEEKGSDSDSSPPTTK